MKVKMTAQEIFDTVVNGLRKQGKKSYRTSGDKQCVYRGIDGCKCAAGFLIEDSEYAEWMEGTIIDDLIFGDAADNYGPAVNTTPQSLVNRLRPHHALVAELQLIHDVTYVELWEDDFLRVAVSFNITYRPIHS